MLKLSTAYAILGWSVLACLCPLHAQRMYFKPMPLDDQAENFGVGEMAQDSQGFLWMITGRGLLRYDGYGYKRYAHDPNDPNSLSTNNLTDISIGSDGLIWVGTRGAGLNKFDPRIEQFTRYRHDRDDETSLGSDVVTDILHDRHGNVWVTTYQGGLNRYDPHDNAFIRYQHHPEDASSLSSDLASLLYEDSHGNLWVGTWDAGLNKWDPRTNTFINFHHDPDSPAPYTADRIVALVEDHEGILWVGTRDGLTKLDPNTFSYQRYLKDRSDPRALSDERIQKLLVDDQGRLWVGTYSGLNLFDASTSSFFPINHDPDDPFSLAHGFITLLFQDASGMIWVGTLNALQQLVESSATHYRYHPSDPASLRASGIRSILEDRDGIVWLGMFDDGIDRLDRQTGSVTHLAHDPNNPNGIPSDQIFTIVQDRRGLLWIGTRDRGVFQLDPERLEVSTLPFNASDGKSFNDVCVFSIYEDRHGDVWIGARDGGLNRYNPGTGTFTYFEANADDPHSLSYRLVTSILEDRQGRIWVGTLNGLNVFDREDETFTSFFHEADDPTSLASNDVSALFEDESGYLWIGTLSGGLNRLALDAIAPTFHRFTAAEGLPANDVRDILWVRDHTIGFRNHSGVVRYDFEAKTAVNLPIELGISTAGGWDASFYNRQGEIYLGGSIGLAIVHPDSIHVNRHTPSISITEFNVFDEPWALNRSASYAQSVDLTHKENFFSFEFAALDFTVPAKNTYRYTLEGFDDGWIDAGTQRIAKYTNVPPGRYTFRAMGSNNDQVWNEQGASMDLMITPPFWNRGWFYLLCGLSLIGAVAFWGYVVHLRQAKQQAAVLSQLVDERTRALVEEKEKTEAQADQLRELDRAKSRFFAGITHEFRTPLTLIMGPLGDLLKGRFGPLPDPVQEQHLRIERHAGQLLGLINELLDLSRLEAGEMTVSLSEDDLVSYVHRVVRTFAPLAERERVTLTFSSDADAIMSVFDQAKLERILQNLLSNALKFTPEAGKVWVTIKPIEAGDGAYAEIVVKDTGPGIPREDIEHIFDRFYQSQHTRRDHQPGAGIGLSLVKELVTLHGGTITVESDLGFGSSFRIRLPVKDAAPVATPLISGDGLRDGTVDTLIPPINSVASSSLLEEGEPGSEPGEKAVVLVVEDNAEVRAFLVQTLQPEFDVVEAGHGVEALEKAKASPPDLILSDVMMPEMDGFALCEAIKRDPKLDRIPFIVLTALAAHEDESRGLSLGADDYIAKPFNADILRRRMANMIAARKHPPKLDAASFAMLEDVQVSEPDLLDRISEILRAQLADPDFGVQQLADDVGMSRRKLERSLSEAAGVTPAELIRQTRLTNAARLLKGRRHAIAEVAYMVGFKSPAHFSKAFRNAFGVTPSAYGAQQQ